MGNSKKKGIKTLNLIIFVKRKKWSRQISSKTSNNSTIWVIMKKSKKSNFWINKSSTFLRCLSNAAYKLQKNWWINNNKLLIMLDDICQIYSFDNLFPECAVRRKATSKLMKNRILKIQSNVYAFYNCLLVARRRFFLKKYFMNWDGRMKCEFTIF